MGRKELQRAASESTGGGGNIDSKQMTNSDSRDTEKWFLLISNICKWG
jgi:hypothetical protein